MNLMEFKPTSTLYGKVKMLQLKYCRAGCIFRYHGRWYEKLPGPWFQESYHNDDPDINNIEEVTIDNQEDYVAIRADEII